MGATEPARRLRRDLGTLESYAVLIGILVGAGIFQVTSAAWSLTGSSVVLGYLVLAPAVLATSVPYMVFLSTPLGALPGGEYTHISRTFGDTRIAFVGAWLKIISYVGALAFLSHAFAGYLLDLLRLADGDIARLGIALASLGCFYLVHVSGVRWFGRVQVAMCGLLGISVVALVVPGLLAIRVANYTPVFTHGPVGFAAALPSLFFAYAGFESLAQTAGEVKDSTRRLPGVFLRGILAVTLIFVSMSAVAFGVVPGEQLRASSAPMADVASVYLPHAMVWIVSLGALMAITTSLNATMLVPSRLALVLCADGLAPRWLGAIEPRTGTPVRGLTFTFLAASSLLITGQLALALDIAVLALVVLYFLHSLTLLALPRRNPELFASRTVPIPVWLQRVAALLSIFAMGGLIAVQVNQDVRAWQETGIVARAIRGELTSLELLAAWSTLGLLVYAFGPRRRIASRDSDGESSAS